MKVGVLALQGAFAEHLAVFRHLGVEGLEVRLARDLDEISGLVIPGGESTSIGLLARDYRLLEPLREFGASRAIWGTCAGAILLSSPGGERGTEAEIRLGLMDMEVERNAMGRQVESFILPLNVPALADLAPQNGGPPPPFPGVFIRAPVIRTVDPEAVDVLCRLESGQIVAARQGRMLATSFHPELTDDHRFHRYFMGMLGF